MIFPGGGIIECSTNHDYYHEIDLITRIAQKMRIPVCFNAVGRVVDRRHMFGWGIMRRAVNRSCVKSMTCRDGVEWINRNLYGGRNFAAELPCSAILAGQVYGVQRDPSSNTIGIGVIRGSAFEVYGDPISQEQMLDMYERVVREILKQGYACCLFSNGYIGDVQFGELLRERLGPLEGVSYALEQASGEQLVRTIASFKAMVTARLHSIIAAYSLDIPVAAISWTAKVPDFMRMMGCPEYAVSQEALSADALLSALERAMREGYPKDVRRKWENEIGKKTAEMLSYIPGR